MKRYLSFLMCFILIFSTFCFPCTVYGKSQVSVYLSKTKYEYSGKNIKPSVSVYLGKTKLLSGKNYTLTYPKESKKVGKYNIVIQFIGMDAKSKSVSYKIVPKAPKLESATGKICSFTIKWSGKNTGADKYKIIYSTNSKFKNSHTVVVSGKDKTSKTIDGLKGEKTYYIKMKAVKDDLESSFTETLKISVKVCKTIILNSKTKTFHISSNCYAVKRMSDDNKVLFKGTVAQIKNQGYKACSICSKEYK